MVLETGVKLVVNLQRYPYDCDDGISGNNYMLWRIVRPEFSMSQYARDDGLSDINKHQLQRRT